LPRGRQFVRAPIVTEKHISQATISSIAFGAVSNWTIADAVAVVDKTDGTFEVEEGSLIKAVYIERWLTSDDAEQSSFVLIVEKVPSGLAPATAAQMAALNSYDNKKNILYMSQGLVNPVAGVAMPVQKNWIAIPKGKQRFGLGDQLVLTILAQADGLNFCGLTILKEWK